MIVAIIHLTACHDSSHPVYRRAIRRVISRIGLEASLAALGLNNRRTMQYTEPKIPTIHNSIPAPNSPPPADARTNPIGKHNRKKAISFNETQAERAFAKLTQLLAALQ